MSTSKGGVKVKIKVCGMKDPVNVTALGDLPVDYIGFIFYSQSSRFVDVSRPLPLTNQIRVGVFVNADTDYIGEQIKLWDLEVVQLHGNESPEFCRNIKETGVQVIKAFSVGNDFRFEATELYEGVVDYFLFDTKGDNYGGNGIPFDWNLLSQYQGETLFWLSGGLRPQMVADLQGFSHPRMYALDLNSGFEERPGLKNIQLIQNFLDEILH